METTVTLRTRPATGQPPKPPGPGSRVAQAWGQRAFAIPFAGRVLALQATHPVVSAGLEQHSTVFKDPWGRAWDTLSYGLRLFFDGDPEVTAAEVRDLHREIKGAGPGGKRYHAWNAAPWAWVHLSTFEATLFSLRALGQEPARSDQETMYEEWKAAGRMYGVSDRFMPGDLDGLLGYVEDTIRDQLELTPTAERLWETARHLPPPPWLPIPSPLWWAARGPAGHATRTLLAGSFPHTIRETMGIVWTPLHQAEYEGALASLRAANAVFPDRLRLWPSAYAAQRSQAVATERESSSIAA